MSVVYKNQSEGPQKPYYLGGYNEARAVDGKPDDDLDIRAFFALINKHKWGIFLFVFAVALVAIVILYSIRPQYKSEATLYLESRANNVVFKDVEGGPTGFRGARNYLQTQHKILESRSVAERVIKQLKLADHEEFNPKNPPSSLISRFTSWLSALPRKLIPTADTESTADFSGNRLYGQFASRLEIQPLERSQLVGISFSAYDRALTAKVANAIAATYIDMMLEGRLQMTQRASSWLADRLEKLREQLDQSEKKLQSFIDKENLVDVSGFKSVAAGQIQGLTGKLVEAKRRRSELDALYRQIQSAIATGASPETLPEVLGHNMVQSNRRNISQIEQQIQELSKRYGPKHPVMIQTVSELESAKASWSEQIRNVLSGIDKKRELAIASQLNLEQEMRNSKNEVQDINRKQYELRVLQRDVETNKNLYDLFLRRLKETNETASLGSVNARIIDPAIAPAHPYKPNKQLILILVIIASTVLAVALAFLYEYLDNTVKNEKDIEDKLHLPVLGILPGINKKQKRGHTKPILAYSSKAGHSLFSESIRTIRTGLSLADLDDEKKSKIYLVTSAVPEEGKSTVSLNIAHSMAQVANVLLIDGDMRRPSLANICNLGRRPKGLSECVAGMADIEDVVYKIPNTSLDVIPSGLIPPNPLELLSSSRFEQTLGSLLNRYDQIIIDSAPVMLVSDALVLAHYVDRLIYIVKADSTTLPVAKEAIKRLNRVNASIAGVVLNMASDSKLGYSYNTHYYARPATTN